MKRFWLLVVVVAVLGVGCSGSGPAHISAISGAAAVGQPSPVTVTGLGPGRRASVAIASTDADGIHWRSTTELTADGQGRLQFDAGALIGTMTAEESSPLGAYSWGPGARAFRLSVDGASVSVLRRFVERPVRRVFVTSHGLVGTFYSAYGLTGRHSAVLELGGSEGGQPPGGYPTVLAGEGHPVLTLAYFDAAGLPGTLSRIPLEYFATALRWLAQQPGVDPSRLVVDGVSRGGEAALLIGATFPRLVHGVIAGVPSDAAICSYPACNGPAWTLHGKPVPYTKEFDDPYPTDNPRAIIPVRRIDGPVLMNCGGRDNLWTSCAYASAVMTELAHSPYPHSLQRCGSCDHFVGRGLPDAPYSFADPGGQLRDDVRAYPAFFAATQRLLGV